MSDDSSSNNLDRLLFWLIAIACAGFVLILAVSAVWDHTIIWLHAFQALQYVIIVALAARRNRWGYFLGIAVAGFWNYGALFVTYFARSGFRAVEASIQAGAIVQPDQIIALFAVLFHLTLIVACIVAYLRLQQRSSGDWLRLLASFVAAIGYFAVIVALFQPRYLSIFPRLLHPHGFS